MYYLSWGIYKRLAVGNKQRTFLTFRDLREDLHVRLRALLARFRLEFLEDALAVIISRPLSVCELAESLLPLCILGGYPIRFLAVGLPLSQAIQLGHDLRARCACSQGIDLVLQCVHRLTVGCLAYLMQDHDAIDHGVCHALDTLEVVT